MQEDVFKLVQKVYDSLSRLRLYVFIVIHPSRRYSRKMDGCSKKFQRIISIAFKSGKRVE